MPNKSAPKKKKKQSELTVTKLLKRLSKKRAAKQSGKAANRNKRNLPSAELHSAPAVNPELSAERYVTEEEALGPEVQNEAYLVLASRYRLFRWGVVALLIIFLFAMFNFFREDITIENFRYLMRNVNFELKSELDEAGAIIYDSDDGNVFALYKSSLVVANRQKLTIYDAGGRSSCTAEFDYASPSLKASEKYLLAYDRSDGDYSIYTSFSQMHTDSTGYPISAVDVTDDGVYAIASRSKEYFGVVTVYNSAFKMLGKIQKNKYIASIDLTEDGKSILIASYYSGESGYITELMTLRVDSDEPDLLFTVEDTFPYRVQWTENGKFLLCSASGIKYFDKDGKVYNEYIFSEQNVIKYSVDESSAAIVTASKADSSHSTLVLLDGKGKETGRYALGDTITSLALLDGSACLAGNTAAWKVEDGVLYRAETDRRLQAALLGKESAWLCGYTQILPSEWTKVE